jgi:branched-chain amino acid transport system permease protein
VAVRLTDGVVFGLILAVAAIGLSLIFGTTKLVNFAHGELVTLGAITAWFLSSEGPRLPVVAAGLVAVVVGAAAGAAAETGIWRPLRARRTGQFQVLVISIGLSLVLRQVLLIWFKAGDRRFRQYGIQREALIDVGALRLNGRDVGLIVVCVVVLVAVALMLQRTKVGKALRAVSDNPDLAASSGINVRRVILFVWILGGALAAGGGVLQGVATRVDYLMGFQLLLLMFAGVILGGLGTAYGAMVGSLVVGLATELSTLWISSELKTVAALVVLVLVLLVRPQGLLGSRDRVG